MTNKELAAKCLIEAAELLSSTYDYDEEVLTENAKYRKYIKGKNGMSLKDLGEEAAAYKSNKNIFSDDKEISDMLSKFGDIYVRQGKSARNAHQISEKNKEIEEIKDDLSFIRECRNKKANGILTKSDIDKLKKITKKINSREINKKINRRANNESIDWDQFKKYDDEINKKKSELKKTKENVEKSINNRHSELHNALKSLQQTVYGDGYDDED